MITHALGGKYTNFDEENWRLGAHRAHACTTTYVDEDIRGTKENEKNNNVCYYIYTYIQKFGNVDDEY